MTTPRTLAALFTAMTLVWATGCADVSSEIVDPSPVVPRPDEPKRITTSERRMTVSSLEQLDRIGEILDRSPEVATTITFVRTAEWDSAAWTRVEAWLAARTNVAAIFERSAGER